MESKGFCESCPFRGTASGELDVVGSHINNVTNPNTFVLEGKNPFYLVDSQGNHSSPLNLGDTRYIHGKQIAKIVSDINKCTEPFEERSLIQNGIWPFRRSAVVTTLVYNGLTGAALPDRKISNIEKIN